MFLLIHERTLDESLVKEISQTLKKRIGVFRIRTFQNSLSLETLLDLNWQNEF